MKELEKVENSAKEMSSNFSLKTRLTVYVIGDALLLLGLLTPNLALILELDATKAIALSTVFATAGTFLLTMFGLLKKTGK